MTGASLGFGKTLLSASYKVLLTSVMTSMHNPQPSRSASDAPKKVNPRVDIELYEMRDDAKKKEEQLYPVVNSTALGFSTIPVSPVYYSFNSSYFFNQSLLSLFPFWKALKFYLFSEVQTWNWNHSPQLAWISAQLLSLRLFPLFHPVQPLWTLYHPTSNLTLK